MCFIISYDQILNCHYLSNKKTNQDAEAVCDKLSTLCGSLACGLKIVQQLAVTVSIYFLSLLVYHIILKEFWLTQ